MSSRYGITQPNGTRFTLFYEQGQSKKELLEKLILKPWTRYCLKNWLSANDNQPYAPENKVKRLLDRCGTLLLRDVLKGKRATLTSYKEMIVGSREINMSDCPDGIARLIEEGMTDFANVTADDRLRYSVLREKLDALAGTAMEKNAPRRKKHSTRFDRLVALRRDHLGCTLQGCRVDVDGVFQYGGILYQIDGACAQYTSKITRHGDYYDMDRVIVVALPGGGLLFVDQEGYPIESGMITKCEVMT